MAGGTADERSLEQTPTWAVAAVCLVFIVISIFLEHAIHRIGEWLLHRNRNALYLALEKLKSELMVLGFISLLLSVAQQQIVKICIPAHLANSMLPCQKLSTYPGTKKQLRKLLFSNSYRSLQGRMLAAGGGSNYCSSKGKYPLVSQTGMHQLHMFIFILAVLHMLFSFMIVALGRFRMTRWKAWEKDTKSWEYKFSSDPERYRLTRQTTFVRDHASPRTKLYIVKLIVCFFRQFYPSVTKTDYMTLRLGFINAHFAPNSNFDFQKYIQRGLDNDFTLVVGISATLWGFAVIFLLINVYGWYAYFWLSFLPLVIILLVGMKLQYIITKMALEIQEKEVIVKGFPVVTPSDKWFWFNRPRLVLYLVHFTLFENAFQLSYILWIWSNFGLRSCFHKRFYMVMVKIIIGLVLQLLCSYVTLPLYSLVTQMGSKMQIEALLEGQALKSLRRWRGRAREKISQGKKSSKVSRQRKRYKGGSLTPTTPGGPGSSPLPLLKCKTTRYFEHSDTDMSPYSAHSGDITPSPPCSPMIAILPQNNNGENEENRPRDFSFNNFTERESQNSSQNRPNGHLQDPQDGIDP